MASGENLYMIDISEPSKPVLIHTSEKTFNQHYLLRYTGDDYIITSGYEHGLVLHSVRNDRFTEPDSIESNFTTMTEYSDNSFLGFDGNMTAVIKVADGKLVRDIVFQGIEGLPIGIGNGKNVLLIVERTSGNIMDAYLYKPVKDKFPTKIMEFDIPDFYDHVLLGNRLVIFPEGPYLSIITYTFETD